MHPIGRIRALTRRCRDNPVAARRALRVAIVAAAVLLRLIFFLWLATEPVGRVPVGADVTEYDSRAREILLNGPAWSKLQIHGPLYPMFLAAVYRLSAGKVLAARALQLLLDVAGLCLLMAALDREREHAAASVAGALWAFYLPLVYYSSQLYAEVLVVPLIAAALYAWVRARRARTPASTAAGALASGLLCGLAAVSHPLSLAFSLTHIVLSPALSLRGHGTRMRLAAAAALAAGLALPILPVTIQNHRVSGEFVLIQARGGFNLHLGNNPDATGTCYLRPGPDYDAAVTLAAREGANGPGEEARFFRARVLEFARTRPGRFAALLCRKAVLTWNSEDIPSGPDLPQLQAQAPIMRLPLPRFALLAPLALAGLALRRRDRRLLPFLLPVAAYTAALTLTVTAGRYRLGMLPGLFALAGLSVRPLRRIVRREDPRQAALAGAAAVCGLAVALIPNPPPLPTAALEAARLQAEAAWLAKQPQLAEAALADGLAIDPDDAPLNHFLGVVLAADGRTREAEAAYRRAVALDENRAQTRVDLAILLNATGRANEALSELRTATELEPGNGKAWYNLGVSAEAAGAPAEALACYRKAAAAEPSLAQAYANAGILLHRAGRPDEALECYRNALRLDRHNLPALRGTAVFHAAAGRYEDSFPYFRRAVDLDPAHAGLREAYALALRSAGRDTEAAELEAEATDFTPPQADRKEK